ncbi:hypothetical protein ACJ41O_008566 [Fusarium nematophilum]
MVQPWPTPFTPVSWADPVGTPMRCEEHGWGTEPIDSREQSMLPESPAFPPSPAGSMSYLPFPFELDKATPNLPAPNIPEPDQFLGISGSAEQLMVGSSPSPTPFHQQPVFSLTTPPSLVRSQSQQATAGYGAASPITIANSDAFENRRRSVSTGEHRLSMRPGLTIPKALVKDGDMIRILLKTSSTKVPCIALCAFNQKDSIADEGFVRQWKAIIRPVPKQRWKDAKLYCNIDVLDVEKVGRVHVNLDVPLGKLQDQRVQVVLSYKALASLHLVPSLDGTNSELSSELALPTRFDFQGQGTSANCRAAVCLDSVSQLSKSAPPSQIAPANQFLSISPTRSSHLSPLSDSGLGDASCRFLMVPQIKIQQPAGYGSTSAEDSSPNGDQSSNASSWFQDDGTYVVSRATSECGFRDPSEFGDVEDMCMGYDGSEGRRRL